MSLTALWFWCKHNTVGCLYSWKYDPNDPQSPKTPGLTMETPSHCTVNTGLEFPCTSTAGGQACLTRGLTSFHILWSKISDGPHAATAGSQNTLPLSASPVSFAYLHRPEARGGSARSFCEFRPERARGGSMLSCCEFWPARAILGSMR